MEKPANSEEELRDHLENKKSELFCGICASLGSALSLCVVGRRTLNDIKAN